ncbi:MAG: hypothetical protein R3E89_17075 [Thiolinea sp.]
MLDEALEEAVKLSHRYIPARQLPDKAVSVLDTACARVAVSQHATPAELEDCQRRLGHLETELAIIEREAAIGLDVTTRQEGVLAALEQETEREQALQARWVDEKTLVERVLALRAQLRGLAGKVEGTESGLEQQADQALQQETGQEMGGDTAQLAEQAGGEGDDGPDRAALLSELQGLQAQLAELQGEVPLILPAVDGQAVASVIADWTGIPVGRMVRNEVAAVLSLTDRLNERWWGSVTPWEMIAKRVQTSGAVGQS